VVLQSCFAVTISYLCIAEKVAYFGFQTVYCSIKRENMKKTLLLFSIGLVIVIGFLACNSGSTNETTDTKKVVAVADTPMYSPPDTSTIPHDMMGNMIRYGRDLVFNTAYYIGPNGTVGKYLGNKMNCTNCHIEGGTRPFGYNYFSAHARYPQYRGRENKILTLGQRINNCIERPHSGIPMPLDCKEMIAIECYIKWIGQGVPVGGHVKGDGALELKYPDRAADPAKGEVIYNTQCASCHAKDGEGTWNAEKTTYIYPPVWGMKSYQKGSSPHRVLKAARFIKACMPNKIAYWDKPVLTDEQAIDVAAFINDDRIHPRPEKKNSKANPDYPDIKFKAIDYGTGPFEDTFSEMQHKFGPYQPIIDYHKAKNLPVIF
jgi:thiosulfate dehydrogenase